MQRRFLILMFALFALFALTACGAQSKEDVMKKLEKQSEEMAGYKTEANMKMRTGKDEQKYHIQVWHKKDEFYRVKLESDKDEKGSQIILKNDSGVYVLTPALNKSFKFQSEWPQNTSQPYLYASLLKDIQADADSEFTASEKYFMFKTKTNYQNNKTLPYQEIYFDKKTYQPVMVKVFDQDMNALVEVQFANFAKDESLKKEDFDVDKNMAMAPTESPVANLENESLAEVLYPQETYGAELASEQEVKTENGTRVIMTYAGDKNFTLIQEKAEVQPASAQYAVEVSGDPVQLEDGSIGAMEHNRLEWNQNGTTYQLASNELTQAEMVSVASSITSSTAK
ncbi:outer membrane lipoprotein carrier protein LolA [Halobacillus yeomjeoni]|uniref:Outer membrane lipoprotein carrier protein LolA n=1 Tax=Halobacillus yeomjeoni TaxID=311194 RepID=A0A931HY63_9BACI|nr:outer membrane lipoprotein carrier protein LolA [Halobacillus yeomjeoni]MBH0231565.1 outer membrane lipoprotein carrier protein LolA [Halobacillus yeomjeoni]MCA0985113.1 outer membrane lipoprotein carrier protein LolA [Halobacillus yeomjeoni]